MPTLTFTSKVLTIGAFTIVKLPEDISKQLPSRGQVAITGTLNDQEFLTVLEPDGNWGHWMKISSDLQKRAGLNVGDIASVTFEVTKSWPEPTIPADFASALKNAPEKVKEKWQDITPMARWEWIRWVNSTGNDGTRQIRIEKSISKLNGKHRRPCCFNLAACTEPSVSKNGILLEPASI